MENKKVSIIIPVYNGEKYMREAIDSALAQTYGNIEIIVVNDGSSDKTDKIARSYGDKIVYLKKENGGVSSALNLALEKMTGDYFSWLSHDDRYYPDKVKKEIEYLENNSLTDKKVILYSDYDLMDTYSKVFATSVKDHDELTKKPEYCLLRGSINGLSLLIPKEAFEECGNFRTDLRCAQDYELWERMMAKYRFVHIPEILVTTRLHENQQGNTSPVMLKEGNDFWTNIIKHVPKERKIELEGSEYLFYKKMYDFMLTTPYKDTAEYVKGECERLKTERKNEIEKIKVTVVIPFFNRLDLLKKSIDSVYAQTHDNIELLLVNDASTDDLSELKKYIEGQKTETRVIDLKVNGGPAAARNAGISEASGEYIAFLDSDDLYKKNKIELQLLEMVLGGADFSHTNYIRRNTETGEENEINTSVINGRGFPNIINNCCIASPTIMFRTGFLRENGLRYDPSLRLGEDVCFYMNCLKKTSVLAIAEPLSIVNVSGTSAAYNREKQLVGLKTIIGFVLNDEEISKYDFNIGMLFAQFIELYDSGDVAPKIWGTLLSKDSCAHHQGRIIPRTFAAIKNHGFIYTLKAGWRKLKWRLFRK